MMECSTMCPSGLASCVFDVGLSVLFLLLIFIGLGFFDRK